MTTLMQDLRYALRQLRKTPGFTITVMLTLALGIGANAAIFTLVNSVLLKSLPVANPKGLVRLGDNNNCCVNGGIVEDGNIALFSTDAYQQLRKNTQEFQDLAAMQAGFGYWRLVVRRNGGSRDGVSQEGSATQARSAVGEFVSGNYFRTFGLGPQAGRLLTDSDDVKGAPLAAVISYTAWQRDFAGDAGVVGGTFWVNLKAVTVVGVAPRGFYGDRLSSTPPDFYLPLESMEPLTSATFVHNPKRSWLYLVGRVKSGVAMGPLQQKVSAQLRQALTLNPDYGTPQGKEALARAHVVLTPGGGGIQNMQEEYGSHLQLLMGIAALVLAIACANIANLLLVRGMGRKTEMSLRTALGAMRGRIIRQLLTESVLLAGLGGLAGLAVAYAGAHMLLLMAFPGAQGVPIQASPSLTVIGFAFGLSLVTGILFGVAPAWMAAQAQPADALRSGTRTTTGGATLLQRGLVVLQAGLSLVLLVGAGLFTQSLNKLQRTDLKLDARNRYIVHINPQAAGYTPSQVEALYRTMEERFHAVPGVARVGIATYTPMEDDNWSTEMRVEGQPDLHQLASFVKGNGDYFDSVGTQVMMGRGFGPQDTSTSPPVAVVNQQFVKTFFKERNPIGARIGSTDHPGDLEIVGVVEDTAYTTVKWRNHSMFFIPMVQREPSDKTPIEKDTSLYAGAMVIATERPMADMESIARRTLAAINPDLTVVKFETLNEQIADRFTEERMIARLTELFGALALLLATIGLYGVTAYTVVRRTPEIGIRMALGAARGTVIGMVMRGALVQTVLGLAIGIPVALLCVRFVKAQLYEIDSADSSVMAGAIVTLAVAACIAGLIPAQRAASIDPARALRSE